MSFVIAGNSASTGYNLTRSLRFRASAAAQLSKAYTVAATNLKIQTYSFWAKLGAPAAFGATIFGAFSGSYAGGLLFAVNLNGAFNVDIDDGAPYGLLTTQKFSDPAAWYHVVVAIDTTQATAANRVKLYINGAQVTSFSTANYPTLNYNVQFMQNAGTCRIGCYATNSSYQYDGYLAEINVIDGQALTPSSFGSFSSTTGVWKPASYTGTYGTNGFYLPFTDNSALTTSSNVGLGKDFSGNGNYWTTNNISITSGVTYDSMTDVPTLTSATAANYCVLNTLDGTNMSYITVSNANLTYSEAASASGWRAIRGTIGVTTGKYRFSVYGVIGASTRMQLGLCTSATDLGSYNVSQNIGLQYAPYDGAYQLNGATTTYGSTQRITAVFDFIFDAATGKCWVAVNGTLLGGNPDAGTGEMATFTTTSAVFPVTQAYGSSWDVNFGQRPWDYTIATASGFVALNTYNLPTSTIVKGNTVMDATLYTGTNATLSVTNAGAFKPDLVWIKGRSQSSNNVLQDSVRGANKYLSSNSTAAEGTDGSLTSFNSNGFSLTTDPGVSYNANGTTYVAWQWQAGQGSSSSNTSGSITSTVSVNASAGFSVVTYTGTGAAGTIGHGLGVAPAFIITKNRGSGAWYCYHSALGASKYIPLNTTDAATTDTAFWNNTTPSSTVFSVSNGANNNSAATYVAYCWAEIAGFSAFGSYTGNGSTDGPFVYTGFRPKYVMIKDTVSASQWRIWDTARDPYNITTNALYANSSGTEQSADNYLDIVSNGFKIRSTNAGVNTSSGNYIYAAFAENPLKFSLAR